MTRQLTKDITVHTFILNSIIVEAMYTRDSRFSRLGTETPRLSVQDSSRSRNRSRISSYFGTRIGLGLDFFKSWNRTRYRNRNIQVSWTRNRNRLWGYPWYRNRTRNRNIYCQTPCIFLHSNLLVCGALYIISICGDSINHMTFLDIGPS